MKKAFEDVRKQVADLNTFVQERISGMKIVQLFNREPCPAARAGVSSEGRRLACSRALA